MKIVVVEDSVVMRRALLSRLAEEPFLTVVGQAGGVDEALAMVPLCKPDAVLLDLGLRDRGSGMDVLRSLRSSGYSGFIFVLSSNPYASFAFECMSRGANGFYDKAHDVEHLIADLGEMSVGGKAHQRRLAPATLEPSV